MLKAVELERAGEFAIDVLEQIEIEAGGDAGLVVIGGGEYRDRLDQSPASLNVLDFKDPVRARLMLFNDVSHYMDHPKRSGGRLSKWWDEPGE